MEFGQAVSEKLEPAVPTAGASGSEQLIEAAILSTLSDPERAEISVPDLLERLSDQGLNDEAKSKATITRLLAESKIDMTRLRKLRVNKMLLTVPINITETDAEFRIRAEVPGFSEEEISVEVTPRSLCIIGREQLSCRLELPSQIDPNSATAELSNNILEITLQKITEMGTPKVKKAGAA